MGEHVRDAPFGRVGLRFELSVVHRRDESVEAIHGLSQRGETDVSESVVGHGATLRLS